MNAVHDTLVYMITFVSIPTALLVHHVTSAPFFIPFCTLVAVFLYTRSWRREALLWCVALVSTTGAVFVLKHLFAIPRPESAYITLDGYGFPSAHAALAMSVALFCSWVLKIKTSLTGTALHNKQVTLFVIAVMIGFSRISLGVHTPFQVFSGFAVGLVVTYIVIRAGDRL